MTPGVVTETGSLCLLLNELALYGKKHCNIIILEGILNSKWYKKLFENLFDEFREKEMKRW